MKAQPMLLLIAAGFFIISALTLYDGRDSARAAPEQGLGDSAARALATQLATEMKKMKFTVNIDQKSASASAAEDAPVPVPPTPKSSDLPPTTPPVSPDPKAEQQAASAELPDDVIVMIACDKVLGTCQQFNIERRNYATFPWNHARYEYKVHRAFRGAGSRVVSSGYSVGPWPGAYQAGYGVGTGCPCGCGGQCGGTCGCANCTCYSPQGYRYAGDGSMYGTRVVYASSGDGFMSRGPVRRGLLAPFRFIFRRRGC